ncbi:MAG: DUF190 domain-containing protein [Gallionella sp.]
MNLLSFYISEKQRHGGKSLFDWLLEEAKAMGVHGGSAFRSIAGFGRHGTIHEDTFFELAGELAVKVEFILDDALADKLLERLHSERLQILYFRQTVEFDVS